MKKILFLVLTSTAISFFAQKKTVPANSENIAKAEKINNSAQLYEEAYELYQSEKYDQALEKINAAIKLDKRKIDFYDLKCYILIKQKKNKEVIETATYAISLDPKDAKFYEIRGNTYYFDFEPEKALQDYRKMISLDKNNVRYYNNYLKLLNEKRLD